MGGERASTARERCRQRPRPCTSTISMKAKGQRSCPLSSETSSQNVAGWTHRRRRSHVNSTTRNYLYGCTDRRLIVTHLFSSIQTAQSIPSKDSKRSSGASRLVPATVRDEKEICMKLLNVVISQGHVFRPRAHYIISSASRTLN